MLATVLPYAYVILALYLCYKCNVHEMFVLRILYLIIAFFFSKYYLLYYIVYHGLLRAPCALAFGKPGVTYV